MEQQPILALGTLILLCSGAGLLFVHRSNPLLKGLNWMGTALIMASLACLLSFAGLLHGLHGVANLFILLAFVCCYRADQSLVSHDTRLPALSWALIAVQAAMIPLESLHLVSSSISVLVLCTVLSFQIETTARLLYRTAVSGPRLPVRFTGSLMRALVMANIARGLMVGTRLLDDPRRANLVDALSYALFIAITVGLGFAFFWRAATKLTAELQHMASTDPLTRVFNRRVFMAWCEKELLRSRESGIPVSVLFVDFDHFKHINDEFGHHTGDEVLCAAVERMQDSIRGIDVLCRWGGEEFAVLLPNAGPEATLLVAERMRQNIRLINSSAERFADRVSTDFQLTASIGATSFAYGTDTIDAMLHRADTALYEAKNAGRDRVVLAPRPANGQPDPAAARPGLGHRRFLEAT